MKGVENHFLSAEKLQKHSKKKIENEVVINIQTFADKVLTDILNRSILLTKNSNSVLISENDVKLVVEKTFDYSFGQRLLFPSTTTPTDKHMERMAELSKQKQY